MPKKPKVKTTQRTSLVSRYFTKEQQDVYDAIEFNTRDVVIWNSRKNEPAFGGLPASALLTVQCPPMHLLQTDRIAS